MMTSLLANWPAPPHVRALTTTRTEGHSLPPFDKNNLAFHVGDHPHSVAANRQALVTSLQLKSEPIWLSQIHSNICIIVEEDSEREADAAVTRRKDIPLAIMTADCLPIVLCDTKGQEVSAIHAGWRGLANGIVENTLAKMKSHRESLMAWIGPGICQKCYEVGTEVIQTYKDRYPFTASTFQDRGEKQYANLAKMAELILKNNGVKAVYQSEVCSFEDKNAFYSYRREAETGRMTTLIWFTDL